MRQSILCEKSQVESINQVDGSPGWYINANNRTKRYDAVIFAAPFDQSRVSLPHTLLQAIPHVHSKNVYLTIVVTSAPSVNKAFLGFHREPEDIRFIISSKREDANPIVFDVLKYERQLSEGIWIVKIISQESLSNEWLYQVFHGRVEMLNRHKVI